MSADASKTASAGNRDDHSQPDKQPAASPPMSSGHEGTASSARRRVLLQERRERKHALRRQVPRSSHGFCEFTDRTDPLELLERQAATRLPELIPIRYGRMKASPFAFLRGSAIVMAQDLSRTPSTDIRTQLCGDCHLANFGDYASPERTLLFDINDFDETLPGPWEWDLKRLATSFHVAGRGNGFSESDCQQAVTSVARAYRLNMRQFAGMRTLDVWYSRVTAEGLLDLLRSLHDIKRERRELGRIRHHDSLQELSKLTTVVDGRLVIVDSPPLVTRVTEDQLGGELRTLFDQYIRSLRGAQRHVLERFKIVDVALKTVGVGSVGTRCFIVLLTGSNVDDVLFLQGKEAEASVLAGYLPKSIYKHQGERVVVGQELMQSASDIFLGWNDGPHGRNFYWRQLRDMKGSVEVENLSAVDLAAYGDLCGWALARAHARASGNAREIAAYLGMSDRFDRAIAAFAQGYADQNERDYRSFLGAIKSGRIKAATGT
jgi:uncharacterized protein (DUF2252 family)